MPPGRLDQRWCSSRLLALGSLVAGLALLRAPWYTLVSCRQTVRAGRPRLAFLLPVVGAAQDHRKGVPSYSRLRDHVHC